MSDSEWSAAFPPRRKAPRLRRDIETRRQRAVNLLTNGYTPSGAAERLGVTLAELWDLAHSAKHAGLLGTWDEGETADAR